MPASVVEVDGIVSDEGLTNENGVAEFAAQAEETVEQCVKKITASFERYDLVARRHDRIATRSRSALYDFLSTVYTAYYIALGRKEVDKLLRKICPDGLEGNNKRTHSVAKILRATLSKEEDTFVDRRKIGEWKCAILGMAASGILVTDAKERLEEEGVVAFARFFRSEHSATPTRKKKPKLIPTVAVVSKHSSTISDLKKGDNATVRVRILMNGTLAITDILSVNRKIRQTPTTTKSTDHSRKRDTKKVKEIA